MKIVFYSETGNVAEFVDKCSNFEKIEIETGNEIVDDKFVLVTPTVGFGDIPELVEEFLFNNSDNLLGVSASGNMGWEDTYCLAGNKISEKYNVPLLSTFEDEGTEADVKLFCSKIEEINNKEV